MAVNETRLQETTLRDVDAVQQTTDGLAVVVPLYNTTLVLINDNVNLFEIDALGGTRRHIRLNFYLEGDAAATFILTILKTRPGDLITFVADAALTVTLVTPVTGNHSYELGDLAQGLQMRVNLAQNNAGDATNVVDATLTYEGGI